MASSSRTTCFSPLADGPPPSLERFSIWLDENGVKRHPELDISEMEGGGGFRIVAKSDIELGTVLCDIPKSLLLSPRSSSSNLHLAGNPETLSDCSPNELTLLLAGCLLHELRLGAESRWYGWLQLLPREVVMIPTLWADSAIGGEDGKRGLEWLRGTKAGRELERKDEEGLSLDDMTSYYAMIQHDLPPTTSHPHPSDTSAYLYAMSLISSRGYVIDAYHGIALVPFVDFFNHSSLRPHTSLLSSAYVCDYCGSLPTCTHDALPGENEGGGDGAVDGDNPEDQDGHTGARDVIDSTSASARIPDRLSDLPLDRISQLHLESDSVDMRAERSIRSGEEIFSCYEEGVGDGKLLVEWGFMEGNELDGLSWTVREVFACEKASLVRPFIDLAQRGAVAESITTNTIEGKVEENAQEGRLVEAPDPERPVDLEISSSGVVSFPLLLAASLCSDVEISDDLELVEQDIIDVIRHLNGSKLDKTPDNGSRPDDKVDIAGRVEGVTRILLALLTQRQAELYRPELSTDDLRQLIEELPAESELERLGMSAALHDRVLLRRVTQRWQRVIASL